MNIELELETLAQRIRQIREAQGLTLQQVSARSKGRISAIALGSYERGDRSISAKKILEIAEIYAIPAGEFFTPTQQGLEAGRVVIDHYFRGSYWKTIFDYSQAHSRTTTRLEWGGYFIESRRYLKPANLCTLLFSRTFSSSR
jgi:transcriptional regulator with XRE-family HTH domain